MRTSILYGGEYSPENVFHNIEYNAASIQKPRLHVASRPFVRIIYY